MRAVIRVHGALPRQEVHLRSEPGLCDLLRRLALVQRAQRDHATLDGVQGFAKPTRRLIRGNDVAPGNGVPQIHLSTCQAIGLRADPLARLDLQIAPLFGGQRRHIHQCRIKLLARPAHHAVHSTHHPRRGAAGRRAGRTA